MTSAAYSPFDIFQWLPDEVREAFVDEVRTRHYSAGESVYIQGEPGDQMFRLVSGSIRLSVAAPDGRELIYLFFEPGDCFGVSSCLDDEPRPHTAEAAGPSEVQVIGPASFERLRTDYRAFDQALLRLVTRHMRLLSAIFGDSQLNDLAARVASRIVAAAQSFGVMTNDGQCLAVRIPQSELALMVGASRQSVNKVLRQFQDTGLIIIEYGALVVRDLHQLRLRAGAKPQPELSRN